MSLDRSLFFCAQSPTNAISPLPHMPHLEARHQAVDPSHWPEVWGA